MIFIVVFITLVCVDIYITHTVNRDRREIFDRNFQPFYSFWSIRHFALIQRGQVWLIGNFVRDTRSEYPAALVAHVSLALPRYQ